MECGIKWVNDIVLDGLKVCGILAQMVAREGGNVVVVGIGVNYATPLSCFGEDLRGIVGSLYDMDESDAKDVPPMRSFVMSLVANLYGPTPHTSLIARFTATPAFAVNAKPMSLGSLGLGTSMLM